MSKEIFVTGLGIISAIGNNIETCFDSLLNEKTGISDIDILQTNHKGTFKVGEVKQTNQQLLKQLNLPETDYKKHTRTSLLGIIAANEAIINSNLDINNTELNTAVISATTVGGMDKTELEITNPNSNLDYLLTHSCGDSTNKICEYINHKGYRTTISTACSSGTNAIIHGINLINHGIVDRAIVGGVDSLSKFTLNGFNSLMILDKNFCKTFDENRQGLNLGEGAGFIVIETKKSIKSRNIAPICTISGYANANDAYHQTASSPDGDGAFMAMNNAIKMSNLQLSEIDYINVHGTGTANNDMSEGTALKRIFGDNIPKFSSTKSFTGHTLAAAAGIEAVLSALSIKNKAIYANLNFNTPIAELNISPETKFQQNEVKNVLSNSFGFGGNNSSIIFSKL